MTNVPLSSIASDPGAAANHVLVRDSLNYLEGNDRFAGSFNGWYRDTTAGIAFAPAATAVKHPYGSSGQFWWCSDIAVRNSSDSSVLFRHLGDLGPDGCAWFSGSGYDWVNIGGSTSVEPAISHWESSGTHRYDVFTVNGLGKLQQSTSTGSASPTSPWTFPFSSFTNVPICGGSFCAAPPNVKSGTAPSAVSWGPNRIDVAYIGTDNAIWIAYWDGAWHDRVSLGGVATSSPGITSKGVNDLEVAVRGTDNAIWRNSYNGSSWSGWRSCGAPTGASIAGKPALSVDNGVVFTYVRDTSNNLWFAQADCF